MICDGGGDTQKRSKEAGKVQDSGEELKMPLTEVLGVRNLVRRPTRRISRSAGTSGRKEGIAPKVLHENQEGRILQGLRSQRSVGLNLPMVKARFTPGNMCESRSFGREVTNRRQWVPVVNERRNLKVSCGKENQVNRPTNFEFGPRKLGEKKHDFMISPNPFNALMGRDEEATIEAMGQCHASNFSNTKDRLMDGNLDMEVESFKTQGDLLMKGDNVEVREKLVSNSKGSISSESLILVSL